MQFKKDELRNAIINEAEREFFEKGYINASLRQIAKKSGTTIGNVYNYFKSKEELFEVIVKDEYLGFKYFIDNHEMMDKPDDVFEHTDVTLWRKLLLDFIKSFPPIFTKRFYILLNCSEGTKYKDTKKTFIGFMTEHFLEHIDNMESRCSRDIGGVLAEQMLGGILSIIRDNEDEGKKQELIVELILFFFMGYMGLIIG